MSPHKFPSPQTCLNDGLPPRGQAQHAALVRLAQLTNSMSPCIVPGLWPCIVPCGLVSHGLTVVVMHCALVCLSCDMHRVAPSRRRGGVSRPEALAGAMHCAMLCHIAFPAGHCGHCPRPQGSNHADSGETQQKRTTCIARVGIVRWQPTQPPLSGLPLRPMQMGAHAERLETTIQFP